MTLADDAARRRCSRCGCKLLADGVLDGDRTRDHRRRHRPRRRRPPARGTCASCSTALAAPLPRPRRRSPSRPTSPACRRRSRPSSTTSGPSTSTGWPCCATRSFALDHLFLSLFSTVGLDLPARRHRRPAGVDPPGARPARRCSPLPTVLTSPWRPGVERDVEESRRRPRPPRPPPVRPRHHRARRPRRSASPASAPSCVDRAPSGVGAVVRRRSPRARWATRAVARRSAWALFGVAYVGAHRVRGVGPRPRVGDVVLVVVAGSGCRSTSAPAVGELGFLRGIWLDSSRRLTWLEDYAAALEQDADQPAARPRSIDGIRFEHVSFRYPGTDRLVARRRRPHLPGRRGRRGRRRERRRQDDAGQAAAPACTRRPRDGSPSTASTWPRSPNDDVAASGWPARSRTSSASSCSPARRVGVGDEPRIDDEPAVDGAVGRAGRRRRRRAACPAGLDTQLGPTWDDGVEVSLRAVAEAGAGPRLHARRAAGARARRADRGARRRDRARAVRALRRRGSRERRRTTAASRSSSRTASRPCAWPT